MLHCDICGQETREETLPWRCACGGPLSYDSGTFRFAPNPELSGMWRYASSLPVTKPHQAVQLGEGMTPLVSRTWNYGGGNAQIFCKFEALNPTGSYKDRGISVQISRLKELGLSQLIEDSSGNAGASMAAYASAAGMVCEIFVPESTSEGKCVQIAAYGAKLRRVPGPREATTTAAEEAAKSVYYASHNWSPYFPEGIKTYGFEIFEQLGNKVPDNIVLPCGQGSLVRGAWKAFSEIADTLGTQKMPRIFAIQSEHCNPLYTAWKNGQNTVSPFDKKATIAEGIASANPVRPQSVLDAVHKSEGAFAVVSEKEIWAAFETLARIGLYAEPTSAVAAAGASQLLQKGAITPAECTVVLLSASGLKATDKILQLRDNPPA